MTNTNESQFALIKINDRIFDLKYANFTYQNKKSNFSYSAAKLLSALINGKGQTISRAQLRDQVWDNSIGTDFSLSKAVSELRQIIGDKKKQIIITVPRTGYSINPEHLIELDKPAKNKKIKWAGLFLVSILTVFSVSYLVFHSTTSTKHSINNITKITTDLGKETGAAISPNGQEIAYIKITDDNYQLLLKTLGSAKHKVLAESERPLLPAIRWSFDGNRIAYVQANYGHDSPYTIKAIDHSGARDQEVVQTFVANSFEWLPDNASILYSNPDKQEGSFSFKAIHIDSQMPVNFKYPRNQHPADFTPRLSADGTYLAFRRGMALKKQLIVVDLLNQETVMTDDMMGWFQFDWLANTKQLVVGQTESNQTGLWLAALNGEKQPITGTNGLKQFSLARDVARITYTEQNAHLSVAVYPQSTTLDEPIMQVRDTSNNYAPALNPVNDTLAFISERLGYPTVWITAVNDNDKLKQLSFDRNLAPKLLSWSIDGHSLAYIEVGAAGEQLIIHNLMLNHQKRITLDGISKINNLLFSTDVLYITGHDAQKQPQLFSVNPVSQQIKKIRPMEAFAMQSAYDQSTLLFSTPSDKGLQVLDLATQTSRGIDSFIGYNNRFAWDLLGDQIYSLNQVVSDSGLPNNRQMAVLGRSLSTDRQTSSRLFDPEWDVMMTKITVNPGFIAVEINNNKESDVLYADITSPE